ncbi:MAG TPA: DinB family protein [Thermoanaerobaculia bacterium]|nr:DinB family protein [Thermoanaerobaculia bacterium]
MSRCTEAGLVDSLTPDQLDRIGVHPAMGPLPIRLWLEFFLLHEAHHLYTILQRLRIASAPAS